LSALCLTGPLTRAEVLDRLSWLESRLPEAPPANASPVVVDLSGLTRVDTSAVTLMIALERRSRQQGLTVYWRSVPASLLALLRLSSAESLFHIE
jgi:ABC-type transporter Mla MlaB component